MLSTNETDKMNTQEYVYINLDYMNMMSDGDESMKQVMLEMLLDELPSELVKMRDLFNENNWKELGSVSHKMKSTLAFVGNDSMTKANQNIETICKSEEGIGDLAQLLNTLEELKGPVLEELKKEQTNG